MGAVTGKIWGISGFARSGKDTVAERLVERHGFVRVGWADPIRRFCQEIFGFSDEQVYGGRKEDQDQRYPRAGRPNLTPREAMQTLGTEWGRTCFPEVWIRYGMRLARKLLDEAGWTYDPRVGLKTAVRWQAAGVVFSDCRFRNELEAVRAAGGVLVRVKRPGRDGQVGVAGHPSEREQQEIPDEFFDLVLDNSGTLDELFEAVDWAVTGAGSERGIIPARVASFIVARGSQR